METPLFLTNLPLADRVERVRQRISVASKTEAVLVKLHQGFTWTKEVQTAPILLVTEEPIDRGLIATLLVGCPVNRRIACFIRPDHELPIPSPGNKEPLPLNVDVYKVIKEGGEVPFIEKYFSGVKTPEGQTPAT
jgi:hypothetical protein